MKHEKARELFYEICKRSESETTTDEITIVSKAFDRLDELEAYQERLEEHWNNFIGEQNSYIQKLEKELKSLQGNPLTETNMPECIYVKAD